MARKNGSGEEDEIRREVTGEHHAHADPDPCPDSAADREFLKRLEVSPNAHQRSSSRASRAA